MKSLRLLMVLSLALMAQESPEDSLPSKTFAAMEWRGLGPAVMSGRIVDLAVSPLDKSRIFVAAATGGVFRTDNRGTTWQSIFDKASSTCIGAIALAPSKPSTLYVGTGEANNQRSSYSGDGIWRSVDGGETWEHMGLRNSHHIARIAVHPTQPETVFVAATGPLYTTGGERGLFKSTDGGARFSCVLNLGAEVGAVDVVFHPTNPEIVYAASYERLRRAWHLDESGPGSGVWKSTDGGESFTRLEGGLPTGEIGRIGLAVTPAQPDTLLICVENRNPAVVEKVDAEKPTEKKESKDAEDDGEDEIRGSGAEEEGDEEEEEENELREHYAPGSEPSVKRIGGEIWCSLDAGATFVKRNTKPVSGDPPYYYGQIRMDPANADRVWLLGVELFVSSDGGKTFKNDGARGVHSDHHALWIDPADADHLLLGNDGGLACSYDGGKNWDVFENLPLAQFYAVNVDDRRPYRIYGGLQDNGSYGMPVIGAGSTIQEWELYRVGGGDGFMCATDPEDPGVVYSEYQFGAMSRLDLRTMQRTGITPKHIKGAPLERWNWMTPLVVSKHQPRRVYCGSQHVWQSEDRGGHWRCISPDLTTDDAEKKRGNVPHCTITMLAESPRRADVLWAGTDDGRLHVTRDGGVSWQDVSHALPAHVRGLWVSRIVPSSHADGRALVALTGYREDRFDPYLFLTDDFGGSFASRSEGLPTQPINSVVEDPIVADLWFVAHDRGVSLTEDGGGTWTAITKGLPPVPVHDLVIQSRDRDLVAGTHGRGIFVLDMAPWRHFTPATRKTGQILAPAKLLAAPFMGFSRGDRGARFFAAPNGTTGGIFWLHLASLPEGTLSLQIDDVAGRRVRRLDVKAELGVQRVVWDLTGTAARGSAPTRTGGAGREGGPRSSRVPTGTYVARLLLGEKELARELVDVPAGVILPALTQEESDEEEDAFQPAPIVH
jgi:photosystem II stability/assembly factor-like uncharacterized protein